MSCLYHIQYIKSWIQAKTCQNTLIKSSILFLINRTSQIFYYMEMEKFLSTWLDDIHSHRKKTTYKIPLFFFSTYKIALVQPKAPNHAWKYFSPHVAHSKSTTKFHLKKKKFSLSPPKSKIFCFNSQTPERLGLPFELYGQNTKIQAKEWRNSGATIPANSVSFRSQYLTSWPRMVRQ